MKRITESVVADALPLPKRGTVIGGKKITAVKVTQTDPEYYTTGITLERGAKRKDVQAALSDLLNCHVINSSVGDLAVRVTHFEMVPTRKGPKIYVVMRIVPMVFNNPSQVKAKVSALEDFNNHFGPDFTAKNPKKWFRQFPVGNPHGPAHRDKLWKFVGWVGESYGYCDKDTMYHRRASTIMPKIKITKAIEGADTFYHTHPSKDEPSLTSPDDYMLYFDLSYAPRNIRHFYTIMKDRIDYFKITPRKDSKNNYVRIDQDNFLEEVDAKIDSLMEKHGDDFPDDKQGGLNFCEKITKETVKWLNKKYGKYVKISYSCFYRVRKNPEEEDFTNLHLGDSFIAKAIADIKSGEYTWPTADINEKPQEKYAYWFGQYYFMDDDPEKQVGLLASQQEFQSVGRVRDRTRKIGFLPGRLKGINHYLDLKVHEDYSNYDMMNLMNLHIDIMRLDSDVTDGGGVKTRLEELAEQLNLPEEVRDNLIVIEEARILGAHSEEAKTLSGDFYMVLLLVDLCHRAVEVMDEVRAGTKTLEYAKYEVYGKLKEQTIRLLDIEITAYMNAFNQGKRSMRLNPPPRFKKGEFEAFIPPEYLQVSSIVTEALEQYAPYEQGKPFVTGRNKINMRVPANGTLATVMIGSLTKGNLQIIIPSKGHPMPDDPAATALEAYSKVVDRLNEYGLNIPTEEQEVGSLTVSNPRKNNQLVIIGGPAGAGKSTTMRNLLKSLPNSKLVTTYTTRRKRKSDRTSERVFVTEKKFKEMIANGEFLEHAIQKSGDYYGKRVEDFKSGEDYLITEASLPGINRLKKAFPSAYTVYLEPSESAEMIRKRLLRRGDMSPQQARGRASKIPSHIKSSKMMPFDKRIITRQGKFDSIALEIMDSIPRSNPATPFRVPKGIVMQNPIGRFKKQGFEQYLPKRGKEIVEREGSRAEYVTDAYEAGIYDIQKMRKQLELMDAIDKLHPSEQERVRTPIVRKFMQVGGKQILLDQSAELTQEEQDYLESQTRFSSGFHMTTTDNRGYYTKLEEEDLQSRAGGHYMQKEVPSRIPFRKARVVEERVPIRKFADETIAFTTEEESDSLARSMKRMGNMFSGEKSDERDMYEQVIHQRIQSYSTKINEGKTPTLLLIGEIPEEVIENLSSNILELDAKLEDIKENHADELMKRKNQDDGEWEEYTARYSYLRGYKHRQSVKREIPTMVETMIYDLYDMAFMSQLQSTTDHEFTHRADISSYLLGTDYSQYDEDGNIITPYDIEQYGEDERTTKISESSPQIIQSQYPYMGMELYPTNPGYYTGLIWTNEKYDYAKFRKVIAKNLEEAEAREEFKSMSHGKFNEYYPAVQQLFFAIVEAPDAYTAKNLLKEHFNKTASGKQGIIYYNPGKSYYNAHLYASGSKDPFFPGDVPVAPPALLRGNPPIGKDAEGNEVMLPSEEAVDMATIVEAQAKAEKVSQSIRGDDNTQIASETGKRGVSQSIRGDRNVQLSSRGNPPWRETSQKNPYFMLKEPWGGTSVPIDERLAPLVQRLWNRGIKTWYSDQGGELAEGYLIIRWPYDEVKEKVSDIKRIQAQEKLGSLGHMDSAEMYLRLAWYTFEPLEALYKAYDMDFPKSRGEAALMLAEGATKMNPSEALRPARPARKAGIYTREDGLSFLLTHAQAWAQHPSGKWIEVDVMMKPLLEAFWKRGIDTNFSDTGGNLEPYPFDADEARKKGRNAIPMGEYALEEKWKDFESQTGDLGVEGNIDNKNGYIWFKDAIPPQVPDDFNEGDNTIRWAAAKDYANLRRLYTAFNVPFPAKQNPPKLTVRIEESTNPKKKLMAVFTKPNGRTKTTHFGARGMSDYTQHKDPSRKDNYLARHGGMGENWKDPTTAGALSRWILWGKPSLRESFNDYKKKFKIEGVMAVTNTRMNPSYTTKFDFVPGKEYTFDELPGHETGRVVTAFEQEYGPLGTSLKEDALHHFRSKEEDGYGFPGTAQEATYRAVIIPNEKLVEQFGHLRGKPTLQKHIEKYGLDYPSIGNEGNNRRTAMAKLGRDMPHLEVVPTRMNPKAPGYNSYAWTTQDWRSIKVNNKGEVDYSKKCGAEDTQVADGTPRLCLPAEVVRTLMKSKNGKEILLTQARKKARAAKGQRVPWHPRIKEIWKRVEGKTVKDRPNPPRHNFVDEDTDPFANMFD